MQKYPIKSSNFSILKNFTSGTENYNSNLCKLWSSLPIILSVLWDRSPNEFYTFENKHNYFTYSGDGLELTLVIGISLIPYITDVKLYNFHITADHIILLSADKAVKKISELITKVQQYKYQYFLKKKLNNFS